MKRLLHYVALGLLTILPSTHSMAQKSVIINEIMQSNVDYLMVDHDFPDSWVELYNVSDTRINIQNYRLSPVKVPSESKKITSTEQYIESGGHLLVYCDKTNSLPFHCNFNLESGKGNLYLYDNNWHIIDSISYKSMPAPNIAYGRTTDGSNEWQYELTPSPGATNTSKGCDEVLPEPIFSVEGHLMTNGPETVTITMPEDVPEDTRIYLTLDGCEPTWESVSDTQFTITIDKGTVIRAKLLSHEMLPNRSTTHSYIFHPRETTLPFVCIATDSTYLYSSEEGILSNDSTDGKPNYSYKWRRPANFEYFNTKNGSTVFNQSGEMAVSGNATRKYKQKSIKLYAKKRFGKKNFKGDFWRDKPEVNKMKSFILRTGGNTCMTSRIDDAFLQKIFGTNLDVVDYQAYEPAILYINGQYKGIFGMRERSNEDYVTSNYDIKEEEIEMAGHKNYLRTTIETPHYNSFYKFYHGDDIRYEEMNQLMDTDNFLNAFIAECYASNTDFPNNNISIWSPTIESTYWRWILKDLDFISTHESTWDMFKYMLGTQNPEDPEYEKSNNSSVRTACYLYEKMMSFPEFRNRFIASYATYLGDFLRPDICIPIIQEMDEEIINEITPTFAAYGGMSTIKRHNSGIERLCNYVSSRPSSVYRQMASYFSLGDVIPVSIRVELPKESVTNDTNVTLCDVLLRTGRFDGAWFTSFPFSLYTKNENGAWLMTVTHADGSITSETFLTPHIQPDLSSCSPGDSITLIATDASKVDAIVPHRIGNNTIEAVYDISGRKLPAMQPGFNVIRYTDGTRRKIFR